MDAACEDAQRCDLIHGLEQARPGPRPRNVRASLHPKKRWAHEHLEGQERGHGVAWETEDRHTAVALLQLAERERAARPDGDGPEVDGSELGEHRLHVIVIDDR